MRVEDLREELGFIYQSRDRVVKGSPGHLDALACLSDLSFGRRGQRAVTGKTNKADICGFRNKCAAFGHDCPQSY